MNHEHFRRVRMLEPDRGRLQLNRRTTGTVLVFDKMIASPDKKEIKESRKNALDRIKTFLEADDVDGQFSDLSGDYYSKERFLVSWNGFYKGMYSEFSVNKTDSFYAMFSGHKATYTTQGLFHEHQFAGYSSIERALIEVGMKLCVNRQEKEDFYNKYAVKYNEKINGN